MGIRPEAFHVADAASAPILADVLVAEALGPDTFVFFDIASAAGGSSSGGEGGIRIRAASPNDRPRPSRTDAAAGGKIAAASRCGQAALVRPGEPGDAVRYLIRGLALGTGAGRGLERDLRLYRAYRVRLHEKGGKRHEMPCHHARGISARLYRRDRRQRRSESAVVPHDRPGNGPAHRYPSPRQTPTPSCSVAPRPPASPPRSAIKPSGAPGSPPS